MTPVAEVIHFEEEGRVGLMIDYQTAGILAWMLGLCAAGDMATDRLYDKLLAIEKAEEVYDRVEQKCSEGELSTLNGVPWNFDRVLEVADD